jgi:glycerophosphoryl diester phosphodiesterase
MKNFTLALGFLIFGCQSNMNTQTNEDKSLENLDWQGHRGCRGLMPENSIEGFLHALQFPIQTLEMDVVVSKDEVVVVSHEPWFSDEICSCEGLENNNIFEMSYADIKKIDCGSKTHPRFPHQKKMKTYKPSLIEVVQAVRTYCVENNRELPRFNIELKSQPEWDVKYIPEVHVFVERVFQTIRSLGIEDRTTIQSFDSRIINRFRTFKSNLQFAFLTESDEDPLKQLEVLNEIPHIFSPNYKTLDADKVNKIKKLKMLVIPWTINDIETMHKMISLGVDGIITDYPNLIQEVLASITSR